MKRKLYFVLVIGLISQMAFAQILDKAKLDSFFDLLEANNKFMGSVAVSQNGKIIYSKFVGFSNVEESIKSNEHSKYRIGSISKTFTAVLIFKAVEMNKIALNQTIDKYFPSIKNSSKITINQLLYHRSGIHNFTNDKDYLSWNTMMKTESEMVEIIAKAGSDFEPDSKAEYSNSNYVLLTYILEKSFEKPYPAILAEYITKPLGLDNTYFGGEIAPKNNECKSYRFNGNWKLEPETNTSIPVGAGGIISSPIDLVKFSDALFGGALINGKSLEQMKSIKDNFGIGLLMIPFYNRTGYGHGGGIDGFNSIFSYFPDGNISYALTSNGANFNINDVSITVLSAVYNKPYEIPEFKTFDVSSEDLDIYLGVYSSTQIPLKITVTKDGKNLIGQATGQSAFLLEATEKNKFKFDLAGLVLEFFPAESSMILKQGGGQFKFTKEVN